MNKVQCLNAHKDRVWHLDWSPDGNMLATCSSDKTVLIWKEICGQFTVVDRLDGNHTKTVRKVKWSRSGEHLASCSFDGTIVVWKLNPGKIEAVLTLEGHESEVKGVSWSAEDKYLATCGRDKTVWIWETDVDYEYYTMAVLGRHSQDVKSVEFHESKSLLISAGYDNTLIVWALAGQDWVCQEILMGHEGTVWEARWLGDSVVSVSDDQTLRLWGKGEDNKIHLEKTVSGFHSRSIYSVECFGELCFTAGGDDRIVFYDNWNLVGVEENAHLSDVNCLRVHPEGKVLASCGDDGKCNIWRIVYSRDSS